MRLFLLFLVFIQISLTTAGPDHFLFNFEVECKLQKEWKFEMIFREWDDPWPWNRDDYVGPQYKSSTTNSKIVFEAQGIMTDDAGQHYEPYFEIYHTCNNENTRKLFTAELPVVPIHKEWYHFAFSLDVTNREGNIKNHPALVTYEKWGTSRRFHFFDRLLLN